MSPIQTETIPTQTIRPSRWPLIAQLVTSVMLIVIAVSGWALDIRFLPFACVLVALLGIWSSVRGLSASVRVSPAGIAFRRRRIAWTDIYQFTVIRRPWVRYTLVEEVGTGYPVPHRLPAPVSSELFADPAFDRDVARLRGWVGVRNKDASAATNDGFGARAAGFAFVAVFLVVMVIFDRPLGWVAGAQASTTPVACSALSGVLGSKLGAVDPAAATAPPMASECEWSLPDGHRISVTFSRYVRDGLHSGSDRARIGDALDRFGIRGLNGTANQLAAHPEARSEPGVPGKVLVYTTDPGTDSRPHLEVLARKANVDIDVQMDSTSPDAASVRALGVATTAALAAVTLE